VEGQRGIGNTQCFSQRPGCHAFGSRLHQQAKGSKAMLLRQGAEGFDDGLGFQVGDSIDSIVMEISKPKNTSIHISTIIEL
jgi:hypothetical protein